MRTLVFVYITEELACIHIQCSVFTPLEWFLSIPGLGVDLLQAVKGVAGSMTGNDQHSWYMLNFHQQVFFSL